MAKAGKGRRLKHRSNGGLPWDGGDQQVPGHKRSVPSVPQDEYGDRDAPRMNMRSGCLDERMSTEMVCRV